MPCFRDAGAYGFDLRSAEEMMEAERRETDLRRRLHPMSVVARVHAWHQPPGGLLPVSLFSRRVMDDPMPLHDRVAETVPADIAGLYVDYMTRAMTGSDVRDAFRVPLTGARLVGDGARAERLVSMVDGFSGGSIRAACMLLDYDRASRHGPGGWRPRRIDVDGPTCWNLSRMVARSLAFLDEYGPVVWRDFRFDGGYTDLITSGDGDFLTCDTLWDFKVSKRPPTPMGTLQVLTYWRMGLHSRYPVYRSIRRQASFPSRHVHVSPSRYRRGRRPMMVWMQKPAAAMKVTSMTSHSHPRPGAMTQPASVRMMDRMLAASRMMAFMTGSSFLMPSPLLPWFRGRRFLRAGRPSSGRCIVRCVCVR